MVVSGFCHQSLAHLLTGNNVSVRFFSMIRQLGIPTWFCSFSAADLRWENLIEALLIQDGRTQTVEHLNWAERCNLLRKNPLVAAQMFDYRWHWFLKLILMSLLIPLEKLWIIFAG
ncbi:hypothetical protein NQD34_018442 [Periophthalmus magnuspinnatus]|nr:hypothetical protein NQD34_018442 [Periophthalmus magnuspinnatus]